VSSPAASAPPTPRPGLRAAWGRLDHRQRRVGAAAALVLVTMVLPWYSEETVTQRGPGSIVRSGGSVSGLAGMSFIEAGLLVVLLGVLALLWGRGTGRRFALPFPDGSLICAAAGWMGLLIVYRLFARPHGVDTAQEHTLIGLNWGIFVSLLAVGVLFAAGFDLRRHGPRNAVPGEPAPAPPSRYPDVDPATMVVRPRADERTTAVVPARYDDPPTTVAPGDDQRTAVVPSPPDDPTAVVRSPAPEDQPTRRVPAVPRRPDEQPTRRTRPVRPDAGPEPAPGHDAWPSRMRRTPRTPTPRDPDPGTDAPDERR
jgi:hypothetical protein